MFNHSFKLIRFILRRERLRLFIWLTGIIGFIIAMAFAFDAMYATEAERQAAAVTMSNPAVIAMLGPNLGYYSVGAIFAQEMLLFMAITTAILNIGFVIRHTRQDEELGRLELMRSLPVGRLSKLNATLLVALLFNTIIGVLTGLGLYATGVEGLDFVGSLLFGAVLGSCGFFFAAISALFSQFSSTSRGAKGYTYTVLIVAYLIRAIGDVGHEMLARVSPLGLMLRAEVYVNNQWWPLGIVMIQAVAIAGLALYLNASRDLGAGLIPVKPGPSSASNMLRTPLGLAWRLLRNTLLAWLIGTFLMGVSFGAILGEMEGFLASNDMLQAMFGADGYGELVEQIIPFLMLMVITIVTIPLVSVSLKLVKEEKLQLTEHLLTRAVYKKQVMVSYLVLAFLSSLLLCLVLAFGFWSGGSFAMDDAIVFSTFLREAFVFLPAMWIMIGFSLFLTGWFPAFAHVAWIYLGYAFFASYFGEMLNLPSWLLGLNPFEHIASGEVNGLLILIALVLVGGGLIGYQKRDISG